jgi:hypothetical protein
LFHCNAIPICCERSLRFRQHLTARNQMPHNGYI